MQASPRIQAQNKTAKHFCDTTNAAQLLALEHTTLNLLIGALRSSVLTHSNDHASVPNSVVSISLLLLQRPTRPNSIGNVCSGLGPRRNQMSDPGPPRALARSGTRCYWNATNCMALRSRLESGEQPLTAVRARAQHMATTAMRAGSVLGDAQIPNPGTVNFAGYTAMNHDYSGHTP